jgi:HEAT repeat protein
MGKAAQAAIPALLEAVRQEKRFEVQKHLFQALALVGSRDLPGFLKAARAVDRQGKWQTPFLLVQFGPNPEDAVKPLINLLRDPVPGRRLGAALALGKLGLLSDRAVPALLKALDDPTPAVRAAAAASLSRLAPGHERIAEFRLNETVKSLDDRLIGQDRNRLAFVKQNTVAYLYGPVDRMALLDPTVQYPYDQLINLLLLLSDPQGVQDPLLTAQVRDLVGDLPAEAIPALVRGINQAAIFQIGFC